MRYTRRTLRLRAKRNVRKKEEPHLDPLMRTLKALHSATLPENMTPEELERQRKSQDAMGRLASRMSGLLWEEFDLSGMACAWVRPERPHRHCHAILYCHGGGYTSGNLGYSRVLASKLADATGFDVMTFEYRLAPEHPYPAAPEDVMRAWEYLEQQGYQAENVIVAGDSAGGNLALVLCGVLKSAQRPLPGALVLMSPWTDMTMSGASYAERGELDPMLTAEYIESVRKAYAPGADYAAPELSPLFADLTGYPPTLIQVGSNEILYSDAERLAQAMQQAGCSCELQCCEEMWHVFQMFPIPKASAAIAAVPIFLLDYWKD